MEGDFRKVLTFFNALCHGLPMHEISSRGFSCALELVDIDASFFFLDFCLYTHDFSFFCFSFSSSRFEDFRSFFSFFLKNFILDVSSVRVGFFFIIIIDVFLSDRLILSSETFFHTISFRLLHPRAFWTPRYHDVENFIFAITKSDHSSLSYETTFIID